MRYLRTTGDHYVFSLDRREKVLFLETLRLYPLVPAAHYQLSKEKKGAQADENQRLLEFALAEQRQQNRKQVQAMLDEPQRFRSVKAGFELNLTSTEMEWLLQVLNDVRMGSWLVLGEPEHGEEPEIDEHNGKYLLAMQLCSYFQSALLSALGIDESAEWFGTGEG